MMATTRLLSCRSNIKLFHHSHRNAFLQYNKVKAERSQSQLPNQPLTWNFRWRWQATLFGTCCLFPWVIAFHHRSLPFLDTAIEKLVGYLWHFEDHDNVDTFEKLPPVKTMYDKELEKYDFDEDSNITAVRERPSSVSPQLTASEWKEITPAVR